MHPILRSLASLPPRRAVLVEIFLVWLVVMAVWTPFFSSVRVDDKSLDWTFRTDYTGYELNALFHDHAFPFWVTDGRFEQLRVKGVHDFFANPETDVLSIMTPLAKIWGVLTAVKIVVALHLGLGVWGCQRLLAVLRGPVRARGPWLLGLLTTALLVLCNGALVAGGREGGPGFSACSSRRSWCSVTERSSRTSSMAIRSSSPWRASLSPSRSS